MGLLVECPTCKKRNSLKAKTCSCGFVLAKFSGRVYWIEYYLRGQRLRERIGPNKEAAEQRLREVLSARTEGRYIKKARELRVTFNDLAKRYHEWAQENNKSYAVNKAYFIDRLTQHFGRRRLVEITQCPVERWKGQRSKETGFTEVDRELATLKHMFTKAIEWRMISENPARLVKLFRKTRKRDRFLTQEEISRLLAEIPEHQRSMIRFALLTGLRLGNLLNLRWDQVKLHDMQHSYMSISAEEAKGGHDLKLPLAPEAYELLMGLPRHPTSEYVFCKENGEPYKYIYAGFREALKRAGIEDCTPHTLRHTLGSHLVMDGVDLRTVMELLGHQDIQTTMRYAHLAQDHKREAIAKIRKTGNAGHQYGHQGPSQRKRVTAQDRNPLISLVPKRGLEPRRGYPH
jgi:integrase